VISVSDGDTFRIKTDAHDRSIKIRLCGTCQPDPGKAGSLPASRRRNAMRRAIEVMEP
jgi:endonuclease YncB( thermonuclease family)